MKTYGLGKAAILAAALIGTLIGGRALQYSADRKAAAEASARDAAQAAERAKEPVAMIGVYGCDGWAGVIVVTGDGKLHGMDGGSISEEQAVRLEKAAGIDKQQQHTMRVFPIGDSCPQKQTT